MAATTLPGCRYASFNTHLANREKNSLKVIYIPSHLIKEQTLFLTYIVIYVIHLYSKVKAE